MADTKRRYGRWAALGVLLLGLGLWWWLAHKPDATPVMVTETSGTAPAPSHPAASGTAAATPEPARAASSKEAPSPVLRLPSARRTEAPEGVPGAFSGRVISAISGQGVPGAELTFAGPSGAASTRTDESGAFRFMPDQEGLWQLASVRAEGFLPFGPDWGQSPVRLVARAGSGVEGLLLALTHEESWTVRVEDPAGKPLAGAQVRLLTGRSGQTVLFPTDDQFVTGTDGEVQLRAPEPSTVEARHPGYAPERGELTARVPDGRLVLRLDAQTTGASEVLAGRVVDEAGDAIAGAGVRADQPRDKRLPGAQGGIAAVAEALTDADGRFLLERLPPGRYDVSAGVLGRVGTTASSVETGRRDVVLTLARGARLTGRVRDERGSPVASFRLELQLHRGPLEREPGAALTVVDPEGRFAVEGLAPGTYTLRVAAHGLAPSASEVSVAPDATEAGPVEVMLSAGVRLEGQVVKAGGGGPITGARVLVEGGMYGAMLDTVYDAITDASGHFAVDGLAPGTLSLSVSAKGHDARIVDRVRVGPGAPPMPPIELNAVAEGETARVEMVGIGSILGPRDDMLVMGTVIPGGGAHEAGLQPGDAIVSIDGTPVVELGFAASVQRIRGPEGSRVRLGIRRAGRSEVEDVWVVRRKIQV
ncbi:carboxypeptidase regulatory-like domain-containing protein [Myxococcus sp. RHSTA-1-4]|uniref:carboxypeptidase regulatory-like domain-containing protein n=1 Tax=Myxococcus sp. RHSTA-1-4 TaxID=2874601 RepID=UPI001CBDD93F|nr:carboxypeptidase regulatory-like domain-containing protein [Myxococcus sp. RHSTA-1-4]MBZ4421476.1 carboxypeptidase regulatory-like domain-containing protein [Myxococcus sp. RHSTA-1-4]